MSTPTRKDWILWGALGCALVATYHAEYTLAVSAGFHPYVALAVPGALDLYVVRALQQRRDVLVAVLAMVAANVASHLIAKEVLVVGWQVIAAVGAIAPLVLWRVYSLKHTRNRQELLWGVEAGAVDAPEYVPVQLPPLEHGNEHPTAPDPTPYTYDAVTGQPESWVPAPAVSYGGECGCETQHNAAGEPVIDERCAEHTAPDRIPDWMDEEYPVSTEKVPASAPELPPLPPEYRQSASEYPMPTEEQWDELTASDREYLAELAEYIHSSDSHTLAGLRGALGIGQARATRLIKYARKEGTW